MQENYQYYLNQKAVASHYLELGNVLKALEHFNNAYHTSFGTEDLDLMLDLAFLYDEIDDRKKALELFYEMIKIDSEFPTSYYGIATIYDDDEEYEKAIYYYQKTIKNENIRKIEINSSFCCFSIGNEFLFKER